MKTHGKPSIIPAELVMQVRRATGMGVMDAKQLLETASPLFYSRLIKAIQTNKRQSNFLYDPIEDEPAFAEFFEKAEQEARQELTRYKEEFHQSHPETLHFLWKRGRARRFQIIKQRVLREKYNIEWFTWVEMNPGIIFD